ncbi:MAG: alpha-amylase family glycosyl hydrolase [Caldilineaceae bacterium]
MISPPFINPNRSLPKASSPVWSANPRCPAELAALVSPPVRHPIQGTVFYFVMPDRFANGDPSNDTGGIAGGRLDHGFDPTNQRLLPRRRSGRADRQARLFGRYGHQRHLDDAGLQEQPGAGPRRQRVGGLSRLLVHRYDSIRPALWDQCRVGGADPPGPRRGIKIFFDIIANHTADILSYQEGAFTYRNKANFPYKDAVGVEFDDRAYAGGSDFPELDAETSFPYTPVYNNAGDETLKVPAWLNNPIYYHNRGDSTFSGENSLYGDFFGLDDLFTEHPAVVKGMIDIYKDWISNYDIDGFRVDTVKHVNLEFWQAFIPAILEHAAALGKETFSFLARF